MATDWDGPVLGIADFDQDGTPEIYAGTTVFNADGTLRWQLGSRRFLNVLVTDFIPSRPGLELLAASGGPGSPSTLYDAAGAIVWANPDIPGGWGHMAVGDLNADGGPEVVFYGFPPPASSASMSWTPATGVFWAAHTHGRGLE